MTNREFYSIIADSNLSAEIREYATTKIAELDAYNTKRRTTPTKVQVENELIKDSIVTFVTAKPKSPASEIATACNISVQKASALAIQLVKDGLFKSESVKVQGKGSVKAYSVVEA